MLVFGSHFCCRAPADVVRNRLPDELRYRNPPLARVSLGVGLQTLIQADGRFRRFRHGRGPYSVIRTNPSPMRSDCLIMVSVGALAGSVSAIQEEKQTGLKEDLR